MIHTGASLSYESVHFGSHAPPHVAGCVPGRDAIGAGGIRLFVFGKKKIKYEELYQ